MLCPNCCNPIGDSVNFCSVCGLQVKDIINDASKSFQCARKFLDKKDFDNAIPWLKIASRLGNAEAMYVYGLIFETVSKNDKNLIYCMEKSAELKYEPAILYLANCYAYGKYGKMLDYSKAQEYFNMLSFEMKQSNDELCQIIGYDNFECDDTKAVGYYNQEKGELTEIQFEPPVEVLNLNPFDDEKHNLHQFQNKMDELILYNKSKMQVEEKVDFYNKEEWEQENHKREENKKLRCKIDDIERDRLNPYSFRMVLEYEKDNETVDVYIGKKNIFDKDNKALVFSWDSEAGNKAYDDTQTSWTVKGQKVNLKLKRKIIIAEKELQKVYEVFSCNSGSKVIADQFLKDVIAKRHSLDRVSDIIASIQGNQNQIIRSNFYKSFIVQGCAGCGKTMVLFHRLKFLLTNSSIRDICVITPSNQFNATMAPLLMDLGINDILIYSLTHYYIKILDSYQTNNNLVCKWTTLFHNHNLINSKPLKIKDDDDLPLEVVKYYYSDNFFNKINSLDKVKINSLSKSLFKDSKYMNNNNEIDIIGALLGKREQDILPKYEREFGVIHKCELFAMCLFYFKRCGNFKYQTGDYDKSSMRNVLNFDFHFNMIMIDEAQDISLVEYKLIKEINKNAIFNLYGDIGQQIKNFGFDSWDEVTNYIGNCDIYHLDKNYRNSSQIIKYTNDACEIKMDNVGYESFDVEEIECSELLNVFYLDLAKRKSVICSNKTKKIIQENYPLIKDFVYAVSDIKGMEFDSVYVIDDEMSKNEKYVSYTRALDKLTIVK